MAENILRLKVDSQEYDNKLKRAAEGLQRYTEGCRKAGGTLEFVEKETLEYVRALGQMGTSATTTRGKLAEMTKAFTEFSHEYNQLSAEEKKGEFGKALNASLGELRGRIQDSKKELDDINKSINGGGGLTGALDNMLGKVGMNVEGLLKFGGAAGAATTALKVAKDAFFNSETSLDEWGRTVQASESLYSSFLSALNNSDISGFLTRMDDIVSAAREAYNAIDDLNTYSAFNQRNEMKERAGYTKALDEYKLNPTADNKKALADANKAVIDGLSETQQKTEDAYMAALRQIATERLNDKKLQDEFVKVFSEGGRNALADAKIGYSQGKMLNAGAQYWYGDRVYDGRIQDRSTGKWRNMSQQEKQNFEFARALSQVNDNQINEVQALGRRSQAIADQIYQQDRAYNRMAGNNGKVVGLVGGGGKGGTNTEITYAADSIAAMEKEVQELTKLWKEAGAAVREEYAAQLAEAKLRLDTLMGKNTGIAFDSDFAARQVGIARGENTAQTTGLGSISIAEQINEASKGLQGNALESLQKLIKGGNDAQKSWTNAAHAIGSVGSALAGIDSPAAKIMGIVAEAIANIALGFAMATAKDSKLGVFGWIAAIAGGLGTMMSTISAIHSATGFAEGGMVQGNTYSGDQIPAMLNAGEVVLNRAQQGAIASQLSENGGGGGGYVPSSISGEQIFIAMNRYTRRTGKGEIVTWK